MAQMEHWQLAWLQVPAAPHIEVFQYGGNPATMSACLKSPYFKLAAQDIGVLESDPAARQRCAGASFNPWRTQCCGPQDFPHPIGSGSLYPY